MTDPHRPPSSFVLSCPVPQGLPSTIQLAHGGGGRLTERLLSELFLPAFSNPALAKAHDGAELSLPEGRIAFSTDAHVVRPLFFPGGDIGTLAVNGTVNDLVVCGAKPLALSAAFILEEGLPLSVLAQVVESMKRAAGAVEVPIVTGDTKVVDRGKGDGVFVTTAGIGVVHPKAQISPDRAAPGDAVLLSGPIAAHGVAVLCARENLGLSGIESDCAALLPFIWPLWDHFGESLHVLRDPTRGGVAAALHEIARASGVTVELEEAAIPVAESVRGACELLGLSPLHVANEGACLLFVQPDVAESVLATLRRHPRAAQACRIGTVKRSDEPAVVLRTLLGTTRIVDWLSGEQLPRIC